MTDRDPVRQVIVDSVQGVLLDPPIVDRVRTPKLAWSDCTSATEEQGAQYATVALPLDRDAPGRARRWRCC